MWGEKMPKINLLSKQVAELIAAGEVVERPASVIKELVENSIDAGATAITVEIQHGGITYMRIADNGCGISADDVSLAFLRHATSKIKIDEDLNSISTLGFRGEALAAISSVSRVEMFTKTAEEQFGTHYCIEGGEQTACDEAGCPKGTTIVIRDIFYNTPARMKFLKKDTSEANAVASVIERIALSHPEISFKFIRDGKQTINTSGDGQIKSVVYSVLGREFSGSLITVSGELERIKVDGLICKPISCRPTRNNQFTFLNGRLVRSGTITAAVEQAYKNSAMVGKFPGFVIYLSVPFDTVDVNVHPAKTEVRFSDEKRIFDAVYSAVKNALLSGDSRPEVKIKTPTFNPFERLTARQYKQQAIKETAVSNTENNEIEKSKPTIAEQIYTVPQGLHKTFEKPKRLHTNLPDFVNKFSTVDIDGTKKLPITDTENSNQAEKTDIAENRAAKKDFSVDIMQDVEDELPTITLIGEAFNTYIIVEMGNSVFMIDKHAAHERILFNKLKKEQKIEVQALLTPATVVLSGMEYDALISNIDLLYKSGFEIENFGNSSVLVRAVPATLVGENLNMLLSEIAEGLLKTSIVETQREENLYHTVACKAAIKAGSATSTLEMQKLAEQVLYSNDIMYCPHGRPVAFEIKKYELEKQFGRIQ